MNLKDQLHSLFSIKNVYDNKLKYVEYLINKEKEERQLNESANNKEILNEYV